MSTTIDRLQARLLAEYKRRKASAPDDDPLTMERLLAKTGLPITRSALHRKLHGSLKFKLDEAQAVAAALGSRMTVTASSNRAA